MTPSTTDIAPFPAWVQAGFVLLFILFTGGVWAFVRYLLTWVQTLQMDWQTYIEKLNRQWQAFLREQRCDDRENLNGMKESIQNLIVTTSKLANSVEEMHSDLRDHDRRAEEIARQVGEIQSKRRIPKSVSVETGG